MWSWIFDLGNSIFRQSHADFQKTEVSFLTHILKSRDIVVERKKKQIVALHHTSLPPFSLALDSPGKVNFKLFFLLVQFFFQHYLQSGAKTNLRQKSVKPTPRLLNIGVKQYWDQKCWGQTLLRAKILGSKMLGSKNSGSLH